MLQISIHLDIKVISVMTVTNQTLSGGTCIFFAFTVVDNIKVHVPGEHFILKV